MPEGQEDWSSSLRGDPLLLLHGLVGVRGSAQHDGVDLPTALAQRPLEQFLRAFRSPAPPARSRARIVAPVFMGRTGNSSCSRVRTLIGVQTPGEGNVGLFTRFRMPLGNTTRRPGGASSPRLVDAFRMHRTILPLQETVDSAPRPFP